VEQESANFCYKGPDGKYVSLGSYMDVVAATMVKTAVENE
jgi:hypothetical protein